MAEGTIRPVGIGGTEGKTYRIHLSAQVRVDSHPITASDPITAVKLFLQAVDLPKLLINLAGTDSVSGVSYDDRKISLHLDRVGSDGRCLNRVLELDEEEIHAVEKS